jgi:hypothetical protein
VTALAKIIKSADKELTRTDNPPNTTNPVTAVAVPTTNILGKTEVRVQYALYDEFLSGKDK